MTTELDNDLEKIINRTVYEKSYPEEIEKYILSIVKQLREKDGIQEGDLRDLLERIGNAVQGD